MKMKRISKQNFLNEWNENKIGHEAPNWSAASNVWRLDWAGQKCSQRQGTYNQCCNSSSSVDCNFWPAQPSHITWVASLELSERDHD